MSKTNCNEKRGQSFKAVENFLRRVAHNLGNSPSQTEVKIVSCIPIDVTDLQQRIFQLQNELADLKSARPEPPAPPPPPPAPCAVCLQPDTKGREQVCCNRCLLTTTSVLSVYCPARRSFADLTSGSSAPPQAAGSDEPPEDGPKTDKLTKSKHIFSKKKKDNKNRNLKTQLVYHAYADTHTPFRTDVNLQRNLTATQGSAGQRDALDPAYLAGVVHRQYRHRPLLRDSNLSDISSPVCRDETLFRYDGSPRSESVCSCCHGRFQNVDDFMINRNEPDVFATSEITRHHQRTYYDSNFYDLVPVKDKVTKNKQNTERQQANESKKPTIKCWPGKTRLKYRTTPTVVNYCAVPPRRAEHCGKGGSRSPRADRRLGASTPRRPRDEIDYSPVYPKPEKRHAKRIIIPTKQLQNAATSSPTTGNMASRQAATTITDAPAPDDKTEATLNQIKDILQSVLTEVKTSGKMAQPPPQAKRDAVVQNSAAPPARTPYEFGASRLLQTYTYSPYNLHMNPFPVNRTMYKPSCSHPMSANNYMTGLFPECPGAARPVHHYPLLVQPQKHLCSSYYGQHTRAVMRHAASAATNTERPAEHSKETERLIKEIYKSIALNIEESSKDNSVLEYMKTKSITDKYVNLTKTDSDTESERVAKAISEIFKNTNLQDSTATGTTDSAHNSFVDERKPRRTSQEPAAHGRRTERVYSQRETFKYADDKTEQKVQHQSADESSDDTAVNEESDESSSETETDDVVEVKKEPPKAVLVQPVKIKEPPKVIEAKKEKSGLFKKMLKIFQSRPRKRRDRRDSTPNDSEPASESDSDDYQTVYSQKVAEPPPKKQVTIARDRPHSKVFYVKQPQQRPQQRPQPKSPEKQIRITVPPGRSNADERRSRYREDKQQWRQPAARAGDRERRHYYQKYETRPVLVHHDNRMPQWPAVRVPARHPAAAREGLRYERQPYKDRPHASPARQAKPHFVASKSNVKRGLFSKGWMKKTKIHCGKCSQDWKDLIING